MADPKDDTQPATELEAEDLDEVSGGAIDGYIRFDEKPGGASVDNIMKTKHDS